MTPGRRTLALALLTLGLAGASAACAADSNLPAGSLTVGPGGEELNCADPGVRSTRALSAVWVKNTGTSPIRIVSVQAVGAVDLELDAPFLVQEGGRWYTVAGDIPPAPGDEWSAQAWSHRVDLDEGVIGPGELWQIVQPMRTLSDDAHFEATRVEYDEDGTRRAGQDRTAMSITGHSPECS